MFIKSECEKGKLEQKYLYIRTPVSWYLDSLRLTEVIASQVSNM